MNRPMSTVVAVSILAFGLTVGAASAQTPTAKGAATAKAAVGTHSTTGVVKSISATTLVITREGKKHHEMTFTLDPSTHREGAIAVGSHVSVRYRQDGKSEVATAVTARQHAKR